MVPMFTCGLLRSNFSLAISPQLSGLSAQLSAQKPTPNTGRSFRYSLYSAYDFFGQGGRNFFILAEMHCETAASLGSGADVGGVAEHFRQRHVGLDDLRG